MVGTPKTMVAPWWASAAPIASAEKRPMWTAVPPRRNGPRIPITRP